MTTPSAPGGTEAPRAALRQAVLLAVGFVATLGLLAGIAAIARSAGNGGAGSSAGASAGSVASPVRTAGPVASSAAAATSSPAGSSGSPVPSATSAVDPVLIGAGDIAVCDGDGDSKTAALLAGEPGTVFTAGDNAYPNGTAQQFTDCYAPTWGAELARTRPTPGNHDHETTALGGYLGYFGAAAAPNGTAWYSYDLGTWHVIALDATCASAGGCGPDSDQGRWLAADLAASKALCTLAIWHQPRFSSGTHGNDATVAPFWDALYAAGADVVVNGHDHDYERFAPQDPSGHPDPTRGIREFVVGTGGAELRPFGAEAANSELRVAGYYGVIKLVLHRSSYEWTYLTTAGLTLDRGNGNCH